jgi:hypothetical protein
MRILILLIMISVVSCSTGYKSSGFSGGYTETQLSENAFKVRFKGNGYTSRERASDFCLLRCAEITELNGFTHFIIVDENQYSKKNLAKFGENYQIVNKPSSENTILCFKGAPDMNTIVYSVSFVKRKIKSQYNID